MQHFPPHFDRLPELPGILPPVRVAACGAADCVRCQTGRGGFQFPWIGPYTRRAVLVDPGVGPQQAWAQVSASQDRSSEEEVLQAWPGLTIDDVLPTHVNRLVCVIAEQEQQEHPRLASAADLWRAWRLWQQGERRWRETAYEPVASREVAIHDPVARSGRTLWMWLGSLEANIQTMYLPCGACGFQQCFAAECVTASCASTAADRAALVTLGKL